MKKIAIGCDPNAQEQKQDLLTICPNLAITWLTWAVMTQSMHIPPFK